MIKMDRFFGGRSLFTDLVWNLRDNENNCMFWLHFVSKNNHSCGVVNKIWSRSPIFSQTCDLWSSHNHTSIKYMYHMKKSNITTHAYLLSCATIHCIIKWGLILALPTPQPNFMSTRGLTHLVSNCKSQRLSFNFPN